MVAIPVRSWCDVKGLTLTALARRAGIALPVVSDYARGKRNPTLRSLQALADVLNVPLWKFLKGPEPGEGLPSEEELRAQNLAWFGSLTPTQRLRAAEAHRRFVARVRVSTVRRRRGA